MSRNIICNKPNHLRWSYKESMSWHHFNSCLHDDSNLSALIKSKSSGSYLPRSPSHLQDRNTTCQWCRNVPLNVNIFAATFPKSAHLIMTDVVLPDGAVRIVFLLPYAAAGIWTHVSRVAPNQRDLLKDTIPTTAPRTLTVNINNRYWKKLSNQ